MRRTHRDITTASSSETADDDENNRSTVPAGELPAYQQTQQQRQSRDPTVVPSTTTSASADNIQLRQIVTPSGGEEFVDILQVQQLLLENAGVSSASSVSDSGRGGVLGHTQRPAAAAEYPHLGLEAALRGHMLFDSYPPTATAVPTQSHHHHHPPQPPPPLPPYYYANYMQQHQQQPSNVEDLFALWLGSSGTGRSYCFIYDWF